MYVSTSKEFFLSLSKYIYHIQYMYTILWIYLNMYIPFYSMHLTVYIVRCGIGIYIYEYITIPSNPIMSPVS